ncbi:hypothetical protein FB451DRAFT_1400694 [Mycena latifolia]|nr:hypothetical protein FB451DRAFT_1400694 [Mycena latifolia]
MHYALRVPACAMLTPTYRSWVSRAEQGLSRVSLGRAQRKTRDARTARGAGRGSRAAELRSAPFAELARVSVRSCPLPSCALCAGPARLRVRYAFCAVRYACCTRPSVRGHYPLCVGYTRLTVGPLSVAFAVRGAVRCARPHVRYAYPRAKLCVVPVLRVCAFQRPAQRSHRSRFSRAELCASPPLPGALSCLLRLCVITYAAHRARSSRAELEGAAHLCYARPRALVSIFTRPGSWFMRALSWLARFPPRVPAPSCPPQEHPRPPVVRRAEAGRLHPRLRGRL